MAAKKTNAAILIDQGKIDTLSRLKEQGYDTANKIKALDAREMYKRGLTGETMGNIFGLQDAIKANHSEIAWLLDGEDPKPAKKEEVRNEGHTGSDSGSNADGHNGEHSREGQYRYGYTA